VGEREDFAFSADLQPSRIRYGVLAATTTMAALLYLDRICLSVAAPGISEEFHLDKDQMGKVFSAFFLSYSLFQVPAGWLGDRWGARLILAASILWWSIWTGATALAGGIASLIVFRLLMGLGQAGGYPILTRIYSQWMPFYQRGLTISIGVLGGRAGGALAPALTVLLITACRGDWRPVFILYGAIGVLFSLFFWSWFRNTPHEHPACNAAEIALIEKALPPEVTDPNRRGSDVPWGVLFTSLSLWCQCLSQFTLNIGWTLLITWLPTYLMDVYDVSLEKAGFLSSLPLLAGMAGSLVGGMATDRLTKAVGLKWGRNLLGMSSQFLAAGGVVVAILVCDPILAIASFVFVSFAADLLNGPALAYFQDAGGSYVGTFLGWANMFGNLGGFVSPMLLGFLAQKYSWSVALGVCSLLFLASGLFWLGVDARKPILQGSPA
jgi:MFS transporter, ACS family, glucarate transporter